MTASVLLGKTELLAWAGALTGIEPCDKYGDLKDGLIFLALARSLFPGEVDNAVVRLQRRGTRDPSKNWALLTACLRRHGVPTHLCSREAVERGHTRHCFNLLVLFYFLSRLSRGERFAVDFAQPVDPQLAAFLQSPESVAAVGRLVGDTERTPRRDGHVSQGAACAADDEVEVPPPSITRLSSPPSAASASPPQRAFSDAVPSRGAAGTRSGPSSRHGAAGFEGGAGGLGWSAAARPRPSQQVSTREAHDVNSRSSSSDSAVHGGTHTAHAPARSRGAGAENGWRRQRAQEHVEVVELSSPTHSPSFAQALVPATVEVGDHLATENRLLREELQHVKEVSQLLLTQQRGAEAAAEMRAAATLHDELAKAKLQHLHEVRQLQLMAATTRGGELRHESGLSPSFSQTASRGQQQWAAALQRRAETAEATAVQLYRELHESTVLYDTTVQQLRGVLTSIADIAIAARPHPTTSPHAPPVSDYAGAAAYEDAVAAAMMAQLSAVPPALRDAFHAQLQTLLLTLNSLRSTNARLQFDAAQHADVALVEDEGSRHGASAQEAATARGVSSRSLLSFPPARLATAVADARDACQGAGPAVQQAVRRLAQVAEVFASDLEAALLERDAWEARCAEAESMVTERAGSRRPRQDARRRDRGGDAKDHSYAAANGAAATADAPASLAQDRCARAEQALRESRRLCNRVEEVLLTSFSSPETHDMRWATDALTKALQDFAARQRSNPAMDGALAEQAETIAALRQDLRQQCDARLRLEGLLREAERQRASLSDTCAALQAQVRVAEENLTAQRADAQARAASLHEALVAKAAVVASAPARTPTAPPSKAGPSSSSGARVLPARVASQESGQPWHAPHLAQDTPVRGTVPSPYTSPRPPGALLSPEASDDDESRNNTSHISGGVNGALPPRDVQTQQQRRDQRAVYQTPPTASLSPMSFSDSSTGTAAAEASWTPRAVPRAHNLRNGGPAPSSRFAEGPSLLLSAAELERRKQEILRRYDVA